MAGHSVIILMISLCCLYLSVDGRFLYPDTEEKPFQPYCSRMCTSSKDSRDRIISPYKCSCSPSCSVFGDCCYDSPHKDTKNPFHFAFVCLPVYGLGEFRVVTSCPPSNHLDSCREFLGHLPPVTSRVTNISYANAFCAACNEDGNNLVRWNVELRCSLEAEWSDFNQNHTRIPNWKRFWSRNSMHMTWRSCKYHVHDGNVRILNGLELRPCGVPAKVFSCPSTWTDLSVALKCRSYEDPIYIRNTPFRNRHCAQCHFRNLSHADCIPRYVKDMLEEGAVDEAFIRSCMAISPYHCLAHMGKIISFSLSTIFDPVQHSSPRNDQGCSPPRGKICCTGERFDINTNKCRAVSRG